MARRRARGLAGGGGLLRTVERLGVNRGVFGGNRGWFYVGTGLWTLRKVREFGQGKPEVLLLEELKPGQRLVIANARPTLEPAVSGRAEPTSRRGRKAATKAERKGRKARKARQVQDARPPKGRKARRSRTSGEAILTRADLKARARRR